jgi:hypothetical protein
MITDEDPMRGFLFYWDLGFSRTLHVLEEGQLLSGKLEGMPPGC